MTVNDENQPPATPKKPRTTLTLYSRPEIEPFPTPRRRKSAKSAPPDSPNPSHVLTSAKTWPRLQGRVPMELVSKVASEIFGYAPYRWQEDVVQKVLEGRDCIAVAGTGSGKSLIFAMLAIAAELVRASGVVLVICPLKSLQKDQVRRFDHPEGFVSKHACRTLKLRAVAINEDNKDESIFKHVAKGLYRIVYASPDVVALVIDEAHVIESWATQFRKDYAELQSLRIIMGSEIPSVAVTGTCSTEMFETIYKALGMGTRPFYGVDRGSNRSNLSLWVRPMEYSASSMHDLLAFIPPHPTKPEDFVKSVFYFRTRRQTRFACDLCRAIVGPQFEHLLLPFTATNSEEFKDQFVEMLRSGKLRWGFATKAPN